MRTKTFSTIGIRGDRALHRASVGQWTWPRTSDMHLGHTLPNAVFIVTGCFVSWAMVPWSRPRCFPRFPDVPSSLMTTTTIIGRLTTSLTCRPHSPKALCTDSQQRAMLVSSDLPAGPASPRRRAPNPTRRSTHKSQRRATARAAAWRRRASRRRSRCPRCRPARRRRPARTTVTHRREAAVPTMDHGSCCYSSILRISG